MKREAGILLSVSSLPSPYGIGCFSEEAYRFVDFLVTAGQSVWQILPLGPTGYGDSPYQSFSSFAGNPYFISLDGLVAEGLLTHEECETLDFGDDPTRVDYGKLYFSRMSLWRLSYERWKAAGKDSRQVAFEEKEAWWLEEYALFMAIKSSLGGAPLAEWDKPLRLRDEKALRDARQKLGDEIGFQKFLQGKFYAQWEALKRYAGEKGIRIIGDIPIYVSADSADVWQNPELFQLDEECRPVRVAGCPPDEFSPSGQLWGNPLYRWEEHRRTGYAWWIRRLSYAFSLYDVVRIDHFRGFDSYYSIPSGALDATDGEWEQGPGMDLFRAVEEALGHREGIAEDLGYMTDSVRALVRESGYAGMKILQFGFDTADGSYENEYLPHRYGENSVAYTGTHDNPTLCSWLAQRTEAELFHLRTYLWDFYTPKGRLWESMIALLFRSPSRLCLLPMQDILGLDDRSRMNRPATTGGNWSWRMREDELSGELAERIRRWTALGGRLPK